MVHFKKRLKVQYTNMRKRVSNMIKSVCRKVEIYKCRNIHILAYSVVPQGYLLWKISVKKTFVFIHKLYTEENFKLCFNRTDL